MEKEIETKGLEYLKGIDTDTAMTNNERQKAYKEFARFMRAETISRYLLFTLLSCVAVLVLCLIPMIVHKVYLYFSCL